MSSYNNIRKIKYTKTPTDVVALTEYIVFEDAHAKKKYIVFRFANNVNQRLLKIKFEVSQYNSDNELLETTTVVHEAGTPFVSDDKKGEEQEKCLAQPNDMFVPRARLKVNYECESIEVKLLFAEFDRINWSEGEFCDSDYTFDEYADGLNKGKKPEKPVKNKKKKEKKRRKRKKDYSITDITRKNKAKFPVVFNIIMCVLVLGAMIGAAIYFRFATGIFAIGDFVVKESSTGFVTIMGYTGDEEEITIPSTLTDNDDNKTYSVVKIGKGAFRGSSVKTVEIGTDKSLVIETGAFVNCDNLTTIRGMDCVRVDVMGGAIRDCDALVYFHVTTARLSKGCFDDCSAISSLMFDIVTDDVTKLSEIFSGSAPATLSRLSMNEEYTSDFLGTLFR